MGVSVAQVGQGHSNHLLDSVWGWSLGFGVRGSGVKANVILITCMGFSIWVTFGIGFSVWILGSEVSGLGSGVQGSGLGVEVLGLRLKGFGVEVKGSGRWAEG